MLPWERTLAISRNLPVPITRVGLDASISKPRAGDRAAIALECAPMSPRIQCPVCGAWHSKSGLGGQCPACVIAVTLRTAPPKPATLPTEEEIPPQFPPAERQASAAPALSGKLIGNFVQSNPEDYETNS